MKNKKPKQSNAEVKRLKEIIKELQFKNAVLNGKINKISSDINIFEGVLGNAITSGFEEAKVIAIRLVAQAKEEAMQGVGQAKKFIKTPEQQRESQKAAIDARKNNERAVFENFCSDNTINVEKYSATELRKLLRESKYPGRIPSESTLGTYIKEYRGYGRVD
jgi:hypothetical protein